MNLTADQREALKTVDALLWKHASEPGIQRIGQILYDLRTNAKPAWEITEARKDAIQDAYDRYDVGDRCLHTYNRKVKIKGLLRTMLEEAE